MRDLVSCFSENAVNVSHPSCSSHSNTAFISPSSTPSLQTAVTSLYRISLSNETQNHHLISVTWSRNHSAQGLTITFGEQPSAVSFKLDTTTRFFRKKKGNKIYEFHNSKIELFWDLSNAKYDAGPEPISGFYLLVIVDAEIALILGEIADEVHTKRPLKSNIGNPVAKSSLISRREHCSGNTLYSTKAKFCENGIPHEILIRCSGENEGVKNPGLSVCIDKKTVIRVKRLQWNFRGNQSIFVDGLLVDLLWDVHDWFFNSSNGFAVFMFRTRSGLDSRLWLEEKLTHNSKDQETVDFSLLIYASKSS